MSFLSSVLKALGAGFSMHRPALFFLIKKKEGVPITKSPAKKILQNRKILGGGRR